MGIMTDKKKMNIKSLIQPLSQVEGEWQASPEYGELPKNGINFASPRLDIKINNKDIN